MAKTLPFLAVLQEVNDAYKLMTKTGKLFDGRDDGAAQLEICNGLKAELDEFKPLIPLILSLRNPGMQDRESLNRVAALRSVGIPIATR